MKDFIKSNHKDSMILDCIEMFSKEEAAKRINMYIKGIIDNDEAQFNMLKNECKVFEDNL